MIDWWPWWVTTAVALPLAGIALLVALVAKRREVRGGLLLVALVGVGLGVASPFVMGKTSSSSSAMSGPRMSAAEFAHRADVNCQSLNNKPASNFGQPAPTPAFASKLDAFLLEFKPALAAQSDLRPPASEQGTTARWMNAMAAVGHDFTAMRDAAKRSDSNAFQAAGKRLSADAGESAQLSKRLGLKICFQ